VLVEKGGGVREEEQGMECIGIADEETLEGEGSRGKSSKSLGKTWTAERSL